MIQEDYLVLLIKYKFPIKIKSSRGLVQSLSKNNSYIINISKQIKLEISFVNS